METRTQIDDAMAAVFAAAGEVGEACLELDWASTPLGAPTAWPAPLRSLVATAMASRFPLLIWWGPELVMIYNEAYRRIIDRKHPFALGRPGRDVFPEIWDLIGPMLGGVIERGEATWSEDQMLLLERAGFLEECYFTFSYSPIRGDDGRVAGVFCAVAEVTDRLIAERRLHTLGTLAERTAGVTSVAEACRLAVSALVEGEGRIPVPFALIYLNGEAGPALAAAAGLREPPGPEAWPRDFDQAQVAVGLESLELHPDQPWRLDKPPKTAIVFKLGAGEGVLVCGTNPLRQLDDAYLSFFSLVARGVGTAISAGRRHEQEKRRLELLAELDRAKTDFFSNVSHELRTPLTLVLAPVEDLLADPALDPSTRATLDAVHRNALRLTRLVDTLLDFSRLEAGRLEPRFAAVDLAELTRELASSFLYAAEKAGLELVIDCAGPAEPVAVDPEMWEKIVLNLLTNAFKFTLEGSIRLRLRQDGDDIELIVADTGPGIPEAEIDRVFERFHRVRGTQARTFEGSGIGLSLVRELVALQDGTVGVASSPAGSVFTVRLPIRRDGQVVAAAAAPAPTQRAAYVEESLRWLSHAEPAGPSKPAERAGRVLVVEDNADMRDYLARILGAHWSVTATDNGVSALESAIAAPPDLVLTDVMMPGLDGFVLLRELRANPVTSGVPVLMLSARAGPEAAIEGLEAGADDYLVKPFTGQELLARVRTNLELARRRSELAAARSEANRLTVADEVQRRFLLLASHELRTPVTILRGYLSMLTDGTLPPDAEAVPSALRQLEATVDEVHRVVELMIEVARFEATHTELHLTPVDLSSVITSAVAGVRGDAQSRNRIRLLAEPLRAWVDVDKLRFIVGALVDNALRYSPPDSPVTVRVGRGEFEQAVISVTDEGLGIDPEDQRSLFTRFGRIVTSDNAQLAGIGLSLYLARELARLHGGEIDIQSARGAGSTFSFRLPMKPPPPLSN